MRKVASRGRKAFIGGAQTQQPQFRLRRDGFLDVFRHPLRNSGHLPGGQISGHSADQFAGDHLRPLAGQNFLRAHRFGLALRKMGR